MTAATSTLDPDSIHRAASAIRSADALVITAGAGMGVDSGLPDFRGPEGFWRAYPPYRALGLRFEQLASPDHFERDPALAWGFYGHRMNLYRAVTPHDGFAILRKWSEGKPHGAFVFTSNVDGQFQRSGFHPDRVLECHGSIHHLQCVSPCCSKVWPADAAQVVVDESTMRAAEPFPACPSCGGLARPNILMFGDWGWIADRSAEQETRYHTWLDAIESADAKVAIIECGAGTAIPTVRRQSETVAERTVGTLIRINVREPEGPPHSIGLSSGALAALTAIDRLV